jgi:hypothetical protein
MSTNCEGIIFFGYFFNEDELEDTPDIHGIATDRALSKGAVRPDWSSCPNVFAPERDAWQAEHKGEIDAWWAAVAKEKELIGDIEWSYAGTYDYGTPYVCIGSSQISASWSEMVRLDLDKMGTVHLDWIETLDSHLREMGIAIPQQGPSWLLTSFYG